MPLNLVRFLPCFDLLRLHLQLPLYSSPPPSGAPPGMYIAHAPADPFGAVISGTAPTEPEGSGTYEYAYQGPQ